MNNCTAVAGILFLILFGVVAPGFAASSGSYRIPVASLDCADTTGVSASYVHRAAGAQPAIGKTSSASFILKNGYMYLFDDTGVGSALAADTTAPTIYAVSFNDSVLMTGWRDLSVQITAEDSGGLGSVMLSESDTFAGAVWQTYADSVGFTIADAAGTHTIYIRVKDTAGNITDTFASIIYDNLGPEIALAPDTIAFSIAAQTFNGTVADSAGVADTVALSFNGGADSALYLASGAFTFNLTLGTGLNTIRLTAWDGLGNANLLLRTVALADTIIQPPAGETTVIVPTPPAPETGTLSVALPTSDTFSIAFPIFAGGGNLLGDSWLVELNTKDTAVSFVARACDPDSYNLGTDQLYRWDEFKYTIFEFSIITDSGNDISDSEDAFDAIWITFHVSPSLLAALGPSEAARLDLFWFNENSRKWEPVGGTEVDPAAGTIRARLNHFSIYAVFSGAAFAAPAANLANVVIYPNPYQPNDGDVGTGIPYGGPGDGSGIYINGLVPGTSIEIYDLRGRLVDGFAAPAGTGAVQWDARNEAGEDVASGVYFAVFKNGSEQRVEKIFIVR